jgi:peptidoglycan/xylan/chitin deacetylase (PgdA/CDA1 family)
MMAADDLDLEVRQASSPPAPSEAFPDFQRGRRGPGPLVRCRQSLARQGTVVLRALRGSRVDEAFGILMYHRIAEPSPGCPDPTMNVAPRRFQQQMHGLLRRGYQPWPLRKVVEARHLGGPVPRNVFVVTFDDGFENVYHHAWPVLRELGIPATVFVATAYLDSDRPFPFDRWGGAVAGRVPPASWRPLQTRHCAEMLAGGLIDIGSHTHTHRDFRRRPAALEEDLRLSLTVLQRRLGLADATFAFPYGRRHLGFCGPALAAAASAAGVLCGLTTESQLVLPRSDVFEWGRFTAEQADTAATLAAKLDGWYSLFRDAWRRLRRRATSAAPAGAGEIRFGSPATAPVCAEGGPAVP